MSDAASEKRSFRGLEPRLLHVGFSKDIGFQTSLGGVNAELDNFTLFTDTNQPVGTATSAVDQWFQLPKGEATGFKLKCVDSNMEYNVGGVGNGAYVQSFGYFWRLYASLSSVKPATIPASANIEALNLREIARGAFGTRVEACVGVSPGTWLACVAVFTRQEGYGADDRSTHIGCVTATLERAVADEAYGL